MHYKGTIDNREHGKSKKSLNFIAVSRLSRLIVIGNKNNKILIYDV